ncbi:hypothetical protein NQ317_016277 [Molorchus minor]|uniref:nicotinate phosphoribosyltransferase n=1 Tax=Molorchus minor TaxID=1323400 RepID=A0ABQ9JYV0_9CUCU|nr:hypothetical protein NQ317_016277 [Molorchus minor]
MAYAYWKSEKINDHAVFDLFYRKNPFNGEFVIFAGLEECIKRAQGPDGGLSASKYAYIGGFDGTSNVLAGKLYGIPVKGTHAHSYVTSFNNLSDLHTKLLLSKQDGEVKDFLLAASNWRKKLVTIFNVVLSEVSDGEFSAFISFAIAFPDGFMALVDTYDVLKSGLLNFCAVALALHDFGYQSIENPPTVKQKVLCRHPFEESKRAFVIPSKVEDLLNLFWEDGRVCQSLPSLEEIRENVKISLDILRPDIKRTLNPTPFKVSL